MNKPPIEQIDEQDSADRERRDFIIKAGLTVTAATLLPGIAMAAAGSATSARTTGAAKKVLVINAHQKYPGISEGRLNRSMVALIKEEMEKKGYEVRETYIEQGYVVDDEVRKNLWADLIIVQSPAFWITTPYIYKKYVDEVFTNAMIAGTFLGGDGRPQGQYGSGGKMQGKRFMLSLTMNAPREAFNDPAQKLFSGRSLDDVFFSASAPYRFCGVEILPAFGAFDVMKAPQISSDMDRLKQRLASL